MSQYYSQPAESTTAELETMCAAMEPYHAKLAAFATPEEIRRFLAQEGVRGKRGSALSCPIAVYISRSGEQAHVTVVSVGPAASPVVRSFDNTDAMSNFVHRFDLRLYPELVEAES